MKPAFESVRTSSIQSPEHCAAHRMNVLAFDAAAAACHFPRAARGVEVVDVFALLARRQGDREASITSPVDGTGVLACMAPSHPVAAQRPRRPQARSAQALDRENEGVASATWASPAPPSQAPRLPSRPPLRQGCVAAARCSCSAPLRSPVQQGHRPLRARSPIPGPVNLGMARRGPHSEYEETPSSSNFSYRPERSTLWSGRR